MKNNAAFLAQYPSVCHFDDGTKPHFHFLIPINNDECLILPITSQIQKRQEFTKKYGICTDLSIDNTIKGLEFLTKQSVLRCDKVQCLNIDEIKQMSYFSVKSVDIDADFVKSVILSVYNSEHTPRKFKKALRLRYKGYFDNLK